MNSLTIIGIAVGLAMDALAVAIAVGCRLSHPTFRQYFRLAFHFGLFQALMPILGWLLGSRIEGYAEAIDHWVAFALLVIIGAKMVRDSFGKECEPDNAPADPTRKWSLMALSVATSIDAFAVGLSIGLLKVEILMPSLVIGLVALTFTAAGMFFGRALGSRLGKRAEFIGGAILMTIGAKILISHL